MQQQHLARSLTTTASIIIAAVVCLFSVAATRPEATIQSARPGPVKRDAIVAPDSSKPPEQTRSSPPRAVAPISLSDADGQELILEDLSARAAIHGMLSLTELEIRFRNPKPRRIEGRFACTLPSNAAISRFAKEVNGQLMEGEVVERLRANQVYEQFLHQMRDPALLEQDQGNRFSARIFPIEANASVRIVLSYTTLLPLRDGARTFTLPLRGIAKINKLTFRGLVTPLPGEESASAGSSSMRRSNAEVYTIDESDTTPDHDIELAFRPSAEAPRDRILRAGDFYLAALRPQVTARKVAPPHDWLFYVDTSASSAEGSAHRIHAIETLLASLPSDDRVQLVAFDQEIVSLGTNTAAAMSREASALLQHRLFLGGTDIASLLRHASRSAREQPNRAIVVASDLVPTLGTVDRKELRAIIDAIPRSTIVDALILGPREDAQMVNMLTSGRGRVVRIPFSETIDDRASEAAAALRRPLGSPFDVADANAEWLYPQHFDDVQPGDEVIVLGKLKPAVSNPAIPNAVITNVDTSTFAPLLQREGYRAYLDYLADRETNEPSEAVRSALANEQVKISVEQRVVIPRTTMLVLESEWDYQRFGLDRRALAAILTIDAAGIARVDRKPLLPMVVAQTRERQMPRPPMNVAPRPEAKDEGNVVTVEASAPVIDADMAVKSSAAAPPPPAVSEPITVTREAGAIARRDREPEPVPAPRESRRVESGRSDAAWSHITLPSQERVDELESLIKRSPRDRELYNQLSEALVARQEWRALRSLALRWQDYDSENPQVYELLGQADERLGNDGEAARANASLIEVAPAKTELLQRAALLLVRAHRASLAEAPLRRALELRPDRANGYRHLALMLWLDGRVEEAARVLESATDRSFPNWYGNVQRVIHEELGYVYRAWIAKEPSRRAEIERRAHDRNVDLGRRDSLRVTLAWETDANDVDLHVVDPRGDDCYYGRPSSGSGLELYEDITQGLGPEVIRTSNLRHGTYHIGVRYFSAGPMGVSRGIVVMIRDEGESAPSIEIVPFRLIEGGGEIRHVASISVK